MRRSYTKPSPLEKANRGGVDWEVRPGGMLVQKRSGHCGVGPAAQTIKVLVSQGSYLHEVTVPPQATFGIEFFFSVRFCTFHWKRLEKVSSFYFIWVICLILLISLVKVS